MKKKLLLVPLVLLLALSLVAIGCPTTTTTPPTTTPSLPASEPEPELQTFDPIAITGSGDKTSRPFTIATDEWVIDWSYVPNPEYPEYAVFGFYVYPRGETIFDVESVLFPGSTSGSTYSYAGAGEYYIQVIAANVTSWEIVISPP